MTLDLEAEYNNRARVPENPGIIKSWAEQSAAYREAKPPREIAYGAGGREKFDLFDAGAGPAVMFVHGGYWQALDKSFFSHMARGLNAKGVSVAVPSYDLCPDVRIGDIVAQISAACAALTRETKTPIVVSGHSAGGHLAACILAQRDDVAAAYAISGVFELEPLIPTSLNEALRLDESEARRLSPRYWTAPKGKTLDAVVGGAESGEFLRQSADMARAWGEAGAATRYDEIEAANHFTVIAPLADPDSLMCARIKSMIDAAA